MAERTKGPATYSRHTKTAFGQANKPYRHIASTGGYSDNMSGDGGLVENEANAEFLLNCVNSAHAIDELGYESEAAVGEALVKMIEDYEKAYENHGMSLFKSQALVIRDFMQAITKWDR